MSVRFFNNHVCSNWIMGGCACGLVLGSRGECRMLDARILCSSRRKIYAGLYALKVFNEMNHHECDAHESEHVI